MSTHTHISTNEILTLRLAAKSLKRKTGISHSEALDQVACEKGFNSWSHLKHASNSLKDRTSFELFYGGPVPRLSLPSKKKRYVLEKTMSTLNHLMSTEDKNGDLVCNWLDDDPDQVSNMVAHTIMCAGANNVLIHFENKDLYRTLADIDHSDRATAIIQDLCFLVDGEENSHAH